MDTILYFYKKRGIQKPEIEPVGLKSYLLVRIGLDVGEGQWFGRRLERRPPGETSFGDTVVQSPDVKKAAAAGSKPWIDGRGDDSREGEKRAEWQKEAVGDSFYAKSAQEELGGEKIDQGRLWAVLCHPWKALRQRQTEKDRKRREQAKRRAWEQEEARWAAFRLQLLAETGEMIQRLALEVEELAGGLQDCHCVYEDSLRKALVEEKRDSILPVLWKKYFPVEEFHHYGQKIWMEQLFQHATLPHFIILGRAEGLFDEIEAVAVRMKSLRWILTEAEYDEELSVFVEDFYTEYGLAIEIQLLEDEAAFKRLRFFCKEAVNIVDFTGENYMAVSAVPEGSIWLDMFAVEAKKRRILVRDKKIAYFSMKEIWKIAQKRCNCPVLP